LWRNLVDTRVGLDVSEKKKLLVSVRNLTPIPWYPRPQSSYCTGCAIPTLKAQIKPDCFARQVNVAESE